MRLLKPREEQLPPTITSDDRLADDRLERLLVASGKVAPEALEMTRHSAIAPGDSLAGRVVAAGLISTEELTATIAAHYGAERIDLSRIAPEPDALALLRREQARALRAVPIGVDEQGVQVAVVDPSPEHVALLQAAIGRPVRALVATHNVGGGGLTVLDALAPTLASSREVHGLLLEGHR